MHWVHTSKLLSKEVPNISSRKGIAEKAKPWVDLEFAYQVTNWRLKREAGQVRAGLGGSLKISIPLTVYCYGCV